MAMAIPLIAGGMQMLSQQSGSKAADQAAQQQRLDQKAAGDTVMNYMPVARQAGTNLMNQRLSAYNGANNFLSQTTGVPGMSLPNTQLGADPFAGTSFQVVQPATAPKGKSMMDKFSGNFFTDPGGASVNWLADQTGIDALKYANPLGTLGDIFDW